MPQFEYARIYWFSGGIALPGQPEKGPETTVQMPGKSDRDYPGILNALEDLGKDGWELVTATTPMSMTNILYLKREITD